MIIALLGLLTGLCVWLVIALAKLNEDIKALQTKVKEIKQSDANQDVVLVKLMYHKAKELEDYEMCAKITKAFGKNFEYDKF